MRKYGRIDANQTDIVDALRAVGASVQSLASVGGGCPDILVGHQKANYCLEIKDPAQPPSKRLLTPDEMWWHAAWAGHVTTVHNVEEALRAIGVRTK